MYSTFLKSLCRRRHPTPVNSCRVLPPYQATELFSTRQCLVYWFHEALSVSRQLFMTVRQTEVHRCHFFFWRPVRFLVPSLSLSLSRQVMRPFAHLINLSVDSKFLRRNQIIKSFRFQARRPKMFTPQLLKCDQFLFFLWSYQREINILTFWTVGQT